MAFIRDSGTYAEAAIQFKLMKNENVQSIKKRIGVGNVRKVNNRIKHIDTMNHNKKYLLICLFRFGYARRYATTPNVIANWNANDAYTSDKKCPFCAMSLEKFSLDNINFVG